MNYLFIIQGEGMGHTTQSLALRSMLEKNGHTIEAAFIGTSVFRPKNPLYSKIAHENFFSPVFLRRRDKTGINLFTTFLFNIIFSPLYIFSILRLAYRIRVSGADAIIVFYDAIGQLGTFFSFSGKPVYSISHHFFFEHPSFQWPSNRKAERTLLRLHSWLASVGARKILALSFTDEVSIPRKKILVMPPLLRSEILEAIPQNGNHIHVYAMQPGYIHEVVSLARATPHKQYKVFLNEFEDEIELPSNVHVSFVSGDEFMESLKTSEKVMCTAGFETLAESVYLNKPLSVVPSVGHFEQYCNAQDALRICAARVLEHFDEIGPVLEKNNPLHVGFKKWVGSAEILFLKTLTE